jgi:myo-inositol 2-dehydrogenase/D-chiro-inositol 1-dehydrogenase
MRFGLIGYGMFGRCHARCLAGTEGVELRAIATTSAANQAAARADHPRARILADWRDLVGSVDIDAVDIVAPNHLHAEMAVAALDAGKHVLLEKPMATTVEDAARVVEAVRRNGRQLSVGHELRLSAQWAPVKRLIDEGAIGTPRYASLSLFRFPYRPGGGGWRHDPARVGSWILEEPIHFYDLLMWYLERLGPPTAVHAKGTAVGGGMFDNFSSWLTFPGGAYATVTQSLGGFGHHLVLEIAGSDGAIRSWWSAADARSERPSFRLEVQRADTSAPEPVEVPESGELVELAAQIREVAVAFAEGRTLISAEAGRRAVVVCLEAERALREEREVPLSWA